MSWEGKFDYGLYEDSLLMGQQRFMQPQGHIQVLLNKLRGFSNQSTLDAPRFCISAGLPDNSVKNAEQGAGDIDSEIWFEDGIDPKVIEELRGERCSHLISTR